METSPNHLLNCFQVLFSPKTLLPILRNVFVSEKELEKRGFKFFKLLVCFGKRSVSRLYRLAHLFLNG